MDDYKIIIEHIIYLRKKLVNRKLFWKINAIQPEIKARRGFRAPLIRGGYNAGICKLGRIGEGVRLPNRNPKDGF